MTSSTSGALARLGEATGTEFTQLAKARHATNAALERLSERFESLPRDDDVALVLMGSWGRAELTRGSDNDFVVLVDGAQVFRRRVIEPRIDDVRTVLRDFGRAPGREGIFGTHVYTDQLAGRIGLDPDDNTNLTRRILLTLESVPVAGASVWETSRAAMLDEYLEPPLRDRRPPRLFLNDVVRYWRTLCVDFAGKQRERLGEGWGIRNAKLRLSRKLLFAGGLLPVLRCHEHVAGDMKPFLVDQLSAPPTDRLADAFLRYDQLDAGARGLSAYDAFLGLIDDEGAREELETKPRDELEATVLFREVRNLGDRFQEALLTLLFDSPRLAPLIREYGIF